MQLLEDAHEARAILRAQREAGTIAYADDSVVTE